MVAAAGQLHLDLMGLGLVAHVDAGAGDSEIGGIGFDHPTVGDLDKGPESSRGGGVGQSKPLVTGEDGTAQAGLAAEEEILEVGGKAETDVGLAEGGEVVGCGEGLGVGGGEGDGLTNVGLIAKGPARGTDRGDGGIGLVDGGAVAGTGTGHDPKILEAAGAVGGGVFGALVLGIGVAIGGEVTGDLPNPAAGRIPHPGGGHATAFGFEDAKQPAVVEEVFNGPIQVHILIGAHQSAATGRGRPRIHLLVDLGEAGLGLAVSGKIGQRHVGLGGGVDVVAGAVFGEIGGLVGVGKMESGLEHGVHCYRDWETDRKSTRLNSSH